MFSQEDFIFNYRRYTQNNWGKNKHLNILYTICFKMKYSSDIEATYLTRPSKMGVFLESATMIINKMFLYNVKNTLTVSQTPWKNTFMCKIYISFRVFRKAFKMELTLNSKTLPCKPWHAVNITVKYAHFQSSKNLCSYVTMPTNPTTIISNKLLEHLS